MNKLEADKIVASVKYAYNKVAVPFAASRTRDWNEFEIITSYIQPQNTILDAGCAHGRLVPTLLTHGIQKENYVGIDISENLIAKAKDTFQDMQFNVGDVCNLPYKTNSFDIVISSAVLHHIPSQRLRMQMAQELVRVAKPGGKIILLVWNAFHFSHLWKSIFNSYMKTFLTLGKHEAGDMYLPFFGKDTTRYVHAFTKRSLQKLFKDSLKKKTTVKNVGKNFFILIRK